MQLHADLRVEKSDRCKNLPLDQRRFGFKRLRTQTFIAAMATRVATYRRPLFCFIRQVKEALVSSGSVIRGRGRDAAAGDGEKAFVEASLAQHRRNVLRSSAWKKTDPQTEIKGTKDSLSDTRVSANKSATCSYSIYLFANKTIDDMRGAEEQEFISIRCPPKGILG